MTPLPLLARLALATGLAAVLSGCAAGARWPAYPAPSTLPPESPLRSHTLERGDAWLRHYLMTGQPEAAVALLEGKGTAPRDRLLRSLQRAVALHHARRWAESNAAFERAEAEADRRWTRSVSQSVGSLVVNDRVVSYVPPAPEMAMIPYYRMRNYLALGEPDGALVEARKAGAYLARLRDRGTEPCVGEGMVHYLAGLVQASAGERADALVSLRQAERAFDACAGRDAAAAPPELGEDLYRAALAAGVGEVADSARARYGLSAVPAAPGPGTGELVVLVEHGWVAHRADTDIHVPIPRFVADSMDGGERTAWIASRLAGNLGEQSAWGEAWDELPAVQLADGLEGTYVLKLAWPSLRLEAAAPPAVRVVVEDSTAPAPLAEEGAVVGDVSAGVARSFAAARPGIFARMVARGVAKYAAGRALEEEAEDEGGETVGWIVGRLFNLAANATEQADTRSWSLLPDRVSVARFSLPAGRHPVRIEVLGADGQPAATLDLGEVEVPSGRTVFVSERVWGAEMGDLRRARSAAAVASEP